MILECFFKMSKFDCLSCHIFTVGHGGLGLGELFFRSNCRNMYTHMSVTD